MTEEDCIMIILKKNTDKLKINNNSADSYDNLSYTIYKSKIDTSSPDTSSPDTPLFTDLLTSQSKILGRDNKISITTDTKNKFIQQLNNLLSNNGLNINLPSFNIDYLFNNEPNKTGGKNKTMKKRK